MKRSRTTTILLALVCLLASALVLSHVQSRLMQPGPRDDNDVLLTNPFLPSAANDPGWPTVRGPFFDGVSPEINIADSWPANGPTVLWTRELGQGYSAFAAQGQRVYTQYQTLGGQFVICIDAQSGSTVWEYRYDWPFDPAGIYPGPRATPTLNSSRVYFAAPSGLVGCLDGEGHLLWSQHLKEKYDGQGTDFGYSCSPIVVDEKVVMPVGGLGASMVALDASNGELVWKSGSESASYTPAFPIKVAEHWQIIGYMENAIVSFDLKTGDQLWKLKLSRHYDEHSAWPIFRDPYLWFSGPFRGGSQLLRLSGGDEPQFERIWESPLMSNDVASSVFVDGVIYGFDLRDIQSKAHRPSRGSFRCIDFLTGEQLWSNGNAKARRLSQAGPGSLPSSDAARAIGHSTVIAADGKLILLNDSGELILAEANRNRYKELARATVFRGEICWTPPALHRGRLYLRNQSRAVCLYVGTPHLLDRDNLPTFTVDDIPQSTKPDFSGLLGIEPEFSLDPPTWDWIWSWYGYSVGIILLAGLFSIAMRTLLSSRTTVSQCRWLFWGLVFFFGVLAGKPLSLWANDFVFTWPVSLFVAFHVTAYHVRFGRRDEEVRAWRGRLIAMAFLLICATYYAVCRELSLVTEWVFLCGFPMACAIVLIARWSPNHLRDSLLAEGVTATIAFSAFFWSSILLLSWKYDIPEF